MMEIYQRIFEYAPDAQLIINQAGRITLANNQTETLFGYDRSELVGRTRELAARLTVARTRFQESREQRVDTAARLLRSPSAYLAARGQQVDSLARRAVAAANAALHPPGMRLARAQSRLRVPALGPIAQRLDALAERLARTRSQGAALRAERVDVLAHKLELVSPGAVLGRGYAIVQHADGRVVRRPDQAIAGERLDVRLAEGVLAVAAVGPADVDPPAGR